MEYILSNQNESLLSINFSQLVSSESLMPRNFTNSINLINTIRENLNVNIVMVGAMALSVYVKRSRTTEDIDFITTKSNYSKIIKYLDENNINYSVEDRYQLRLYGNKELCEVDILFIFTEIQLSILDNYNVVSLFNTKTRVTTPEGLMIMYLMSDKLQNKVDAKSLIKSGAFDYKRFSKLLSELDEYDKIELLNEYNKIVNIKDGRYGVR